MWRFIISKEHLVKALEEIKAAEDNGFMYCIPTFEIIEYGYSISDIKAKYCDLIEKAHPTDGNFNWGVGQGVSKHNTFLDGKLIPKNK